MRQSRFGNATTSAIGQGTWRLDANRKAAAVDALRQGLDAGMTHVDTAEMYGEAEPLVAEALGRRRDEIFLVSKVLPSNAAKAKTIAACERSLKRLGTDRLDCYLLHWRGSVPLVETIEAFEQLVSDGKILSWGVSNFDVDDLDEAMALAGKGKIACNQVLYHLEERAIEHAVIPWCEANGVAVVAYSPFGSGDFPDGASSGGQALTAVAAEVGGTVRQVALAFLTRRPPVLAIPKAGIAAHALDNAGAGVLTLSAEQVARLDGAFPIGPKLRGLPMI